MFGKWCQQSVSGGLGEKNETQKLKSWTKPPSRVVLYFILGQAHIKKVNGEFDSVMLQQFLEEIQACCNHLGNELPSTFLHLLRRTIKRYCLFLRQTDIVHNV